MVLDIAQGDKNREDHQSVVNSMSRRLSVSAVNERKRRQ